MIDWTEREERIEEKLVGEFQGKNSMRIWMEDRSIVSFQMAGRVEMNSEEEG